MTLKNHIIIHHYKFYFETKGKNFKDTNGEFGETLHYTLKKHEQDHGYSVKRKKGTPHHRGKAFMNISHFNATKMGSPATKKMRLGHSSGRSSPIGWVFSQRNAEKLSL
jgi:hypothetical protein